MSTLSPGLAQTIRSAIDAAQRGLHTGLPAYVKKYDDAQNTCDVQPVLQDVFLDELGNEVAADPPVLTGVPVQWPGGGGWYVKGGLQVGDIVYLSFAERSLDRWRAYSGDKPIDPEEARHHDLSDAQAVPAPGRGYPATGGDLVLGRIDGANEVRLKADGSVLLGAGATRGVARINDAVRSDATLDSAFWTAVGALDAFARAASSPLALDRKSVV